ncbi:hypothetical protein [Pseudoalteromonas sp. S558]|uniref:hypothetical protein n=1 Tax=Pseudoalteromonas sp. S558 TaxID=2066515 RepID=UPI00110A9B77|nr:hypothetical protein [Pseudoalteromonas sp. S558]TMO03410.1 hypothetical protein CWB66_10725 [Pseudoalteromonas sp. S558]
MIKFVLLFLSVLLANGCTENKLKWQGYCLPLDKLTPASLADTPNKDENYDSATNYGPSLFFSGENVTKEIATFKAFTSDLSSGKYRYNVQVNLSKTSIEKSPKTIQSLVKSDLEEIYFDMQSKYHWDAYKKGDETYEFWGSCMLDGSGKSKEGYSCLRQLKVEKIVLNFNLDYVNLNSHKDIDSFLTNKLINWNCN